MTHDLVCGRELDPALIDRVVRRLPNGVGETDPSAGTKRYHRGRWFYFCSLSCRRLFIADPERYITEANPA